MSGDNFDLKSKNQMENDNDERIVRIILLSRTIADNYGFGLVRTRDEFKFDQNFYIIEKSMTHLLKNLYSMEDFCKIILQPYLEKI